MKKISTDKLITRLKMGFKKSAETSSFMKNGFKMTTFELLWKNCGLNEVISGTKQLLFLLQVYLYSVSPCFLVFSNKFGIELIFKILATFYFQNHQSIFEIEEEISFQYEPFS